MHDAVLHAKLAVVDDTWTVIGSSNLDRRSVVFNNEVDAVILGHDTAGQVEAVMRRYMAASREVDLARWDQRPLRERVQGAGGEGLAILDVNPAPQPPSPRLTACARFDQTRPNGIVQGHWPCVANSLWRLDA